MITIRCIGEYFRNSYLYWKSHTIHRNLHCSVLLNCSAMRDTGAAKVIVGLTTFSLALLARDWYRLHGEKLTRALKALLNVSSMLHSFEFVFSTMNNLLSSLYFIYTQAYFITSTKCKNKQQ